MSTLNVVVLAGQKVAIVNEKFAKTFFAGRNPIGQLIGDEPTFIENGRKGVFIPSTEIVGVVKDCHFTSVKQSPLPMVYRPWRQHRKDNPYDPLDAMTYYVRFTLPPTQIFAQVRKAVRELDSKLSLDDLHTMEDQVNLNLSGDRQIFQLAVILAALAMALAMMGLYGVMAYSVVRRSREIGIRIAIGAKPAGIRKMILREMLLILAIGLALGIPAAFTISKSAQSQLFGVSAYDPTVVVCASLALGLAAFAAAHVPARRASRIDPLSALRYE